MYVGIDVGGTKTLVASLSDDGAILHSAKFPTPKVYEEFLEQLKTTLNSLPERDFTAGGIGVAATEIDRQHELCVSFGNLPWRGVFIARDVSRLTGCPMVFENDAKMGALAEAAEEPDASKVLYIAIGTGIGIGLVVDGVIDTAVGDGGGRTMLLEWHGKMVPWESFASGHAIFERFGAKASDIDDEKTWQVISHDIALGLIDLIALTEPDLVVIGGGIGTHFKKYSDHLDAALAALTADNPLLTIPRIKGAAHAEEAVVYGCYQLAKQKHGTAA